MLEVSTGSRLHFGLLELAPGQPLRFGGLGLMLAEPGWLLRFGTGDTSSYLRGSDQNSICPDISGRIEQVRERLRQQTGEEYNFPIEVVRTLPMHSGLGAGTQLAAAVAVGLSLCLRGSTEPSIHQLLDSSGRGKRSGIGLFGFIHGGLILDEGHSQESVRTVRAASVNLNQDWRVVLITPDQLDAVTGGHEASLLERLGQSPNPSRTRMYDLANRSMELAKQADSFSDFTNTLQDYVDAAGQLFASSQGGMYNGESISRAVALAKENGLRAVGQSSWGPTVFGFAANQAVAEKITAKLAEMRPNERWQIRICTPARQGASWRWVDE